MNLREVLIELGGLPKRAAVRLNGNVVTDLTSVNLLHGEHEIQVGESTVYTVETYMGVIVTSDKRIIRKRKEETANAEN